jgi:hypothetical protein
MLSWRPKQTRNIDLGGVFKTQKGNGLVLSSTHIPPRRAQAHGTHQTRALEQQTQ